MTCRKQRCNCIGDLLWASNLANGMYRTHFVERLLGAKYVYAVIAVHEKSSQIVFPVTLIAVLVVFLFRVLAVSEHWPSIVPLAAAAAGPGARE